MSDSDILNQFDDNSSVFIQFSRSMESLISTLLTSSGIKQHSVTSRVKDRSSLSKKVSRKNKYECISDITDVVGVRIISNYSDEVDKISRIIEKEFSVDRENSIDKRAALDPDRFGYLSLHYVVKLNPARSKLLEYSEFRDLKFEIQIRSILQHTWAEIEHDIGYKSNREIPRQVRRKFSQLAGLLELADSQFIQIRDELEKYSEEVDENLKKDNKDILLDKVSLIKYLSSSELVCNLDNEISVITNSSLNSPSDTIISNHLKNLEFFNINTVDQLEKMLNENKELILKRAQDVSNAPHTAPSRQGLIAGISIYYGCQVLASKLKNKEGIIEFLLLVNKYHNEDFVDYLMNFPCYE